MKRLPLLAILLAAAIAAGVGYLLLERRQFVSVITLGDTKTRDKDTFKGAIPLNSPITVLKPARLTIDSGLSCDEATNEINAFAAYDHVRAALVGGEDPVTVEYLNCFLTANLVDATPEIALQRLIGEVFESNVLYSYLRTAFEKVLFQSIKQGNLRHGLLAWSSGFLGEAALLGYERTNEKRYVALYLGYFDRLMQLRDSVLGIRDDYHGRVMDSWGSANLGRNSGDASLWVAHVTHFSVIMKPATGFAKVIRSDPNLAEFAGEADRIVEFFKNAYRQFDVDLRPAKGSNEVWFWRPLVGKFEATNHLHIQGQALLNMYAATGDEFYADRIRWIIRVFERGVVLDNQGMISWNYHPYLQVPEAMNDRNARQYSEFVWKASLTVPFLYDAESAGFAINPIIMAATTRTIRDYVVADNDFKQNLHPTGSTAVSERKRRRKSGGEPASITGFLSAAEDDPRIAEQILGIISSRHDVYPQGWFKTDRLVRGYAYFLK